MGAEPEEVWRFVTDPEHLPRWWPAVQRVEDTTPGAWTNVLRSPKGRTVRADYSLADSEPLRRVVWRHEVDESPFERILRESWIEIEIEPADEGGSLVSITSRQRGRGFARFGFVQMRRAAARQVRDALDGLVRVLGEPAA